MAEFILEWGVTCQDFLLCVYHDYTEHANSALCDVYLEAMVSLGSEIFIHWMVLPALSCWKDPWPLNFCISWGLVNLFGLLSVFSARLLLEVVVLFSLAIWIPRYWSVSKVFHFFLPHYSVTFTCLTSVIRKGQLKASCPLGIENCS